MCVKAGRKAQGKGNTTINGRHVCGRHGGVCNGNVNPNPRERTTKQVQGQVVVGEGWWVGTGNSKIQGRRQRVAGNWNRWGTEGWGRRSLGCVAGMAGNKQL